MKQGGGGAQRIKTYISLWSFGKEIWENWAYRLRVYGHIKDFYEKNTSKTIWKHGATEEKGGDIEIRYRWRETILGRHHWRFTCRISDAGVVSSSRTRVWLCWGNWNDEQIRNLNSKQCDTRVSMCAVFISRQVKKDNLVFNCNKFERAPRKRKIEILHLTRTAGVYNSKSLHNSFKYAGKPFPMVLH